MREVLRRLPTRLASVIEAPENVIDFEVAVAIQRIGLLRRGRDIRGVFGDCPQSISATGSAFGKLRISMRVLGLSSPRHDAAAALLTEAGIEAAIEESKLVRTRASTGLPHAAVQFCFKRGGISWHDISAVAIASRPICSWFRESWRHTRCVPYSPMESARSQVRTIGELGAELNSRIVLQEENSNAGRHIISFEHHLCHAASAFYASPFERALILTIDEKGGGLSGVVAIGEGSKIRTLQTIPLPHSLGAVYSHVTKLLGFVPQAEEHKTQWLSLRGEPVFQNIFLSMLGGSPNGRLRFDSSYFNGGVSDRIEFSDQFFRRLGISGHKVTEMPKDVAPQIASSLQTACAIVVAALLEDWRRRTSALDLCLAGGLFLNTLLVATLEKNTDFREVFVQPAAGNAGCALGAAWLAMHHVFGQPRQEPIKHMYWGPRFGAGEIKEVLDNCKASYRWFRTEEERNEQTIRLLQAGKIVAWFQGAAEFGPRALGNRSLLASPWAPFVKENLNDYVKHRETFRPFAIAVPQEDRPRYFDCSPAGDFMASVGWANATARELINEFVLPGNRVRLQVVRRLANPTFWRLLKKFGEQAPAPFLINTSFNLFGEPLVVSPRDALRSYFCSGVDALVIDGFILSK